MTPTLASEPTIRTPVIAMAQPPIQPNHGPIARVTQENVVPQSGSTRLSAAKADAISSIGTNDASSTPGALTPMRATSAPMIAASEYAGEVEASPITSASTKPMAPGRRVGLVRRARRPGLLGPRSCDGYRSAVRRERQGFRWSNYLLRDEVVSLG